MYCIKEQFIVKDNTSSYHLSDGPTHLVNCFSLSAMFHWLEHFFNQVQSHKVKAQRQELCTDHVYFVNTVWEMAAENVSLGICCSGAVSRLTFWTVLWSIPELCDPAQVNHSCIWPMNSHGFPCMEATEWRKGCIFLCHMLWSNPELLNYMSHMVTGR